jgi:hypothetical protein
VVLEVQLAVAEAVAAVEAALDILQLEVVDKMVELAIHTGVALVALVAQVAVAAVE